MCCVLPVDVSCFTISQDEESLDDSKDREGNCEEKKPKDDENETEVEEEEIEEDMKKDTDLQIEKSSSEEETEKEEVISNEDKTENDDNKALQADLLPVDKDDNKDTGGEKKDEAEDEASESESVEDVRMVTFEYGVCYSTREAFYIGVALLIHIQLVKLLEISCRGSLLWTLIQSLLCLLKLYYFFLLFSLICWLHCFLIWDISTLDIQRDQNTIQSTFSEHLVIFFFLTKHLIILWLLCNRLVFYN